VPARPGQRHRRRRTLRQTSTTAPAVFNPVQGDGDSDWIGNLCDRCLHVSDPSQLDSDGDGEGDACDCRPADPAVRRPPEPTLVVHQNGDLILTIAGPGADSFSNPARGHRCPGHEGFRLLPCRSPVRPGPAARAPHVLRRQGSGGRPRLLLPRPGQEPELRPQLSRLRLLRDRADQHEYKSL